MTKHMFFCLVEITFADIYTITLDKPFSGFKIFMLWAMGDASNA